MKMEKIELLAPAGNLRILKAAVDSGADAVYCGLTVFNARINAENLTLGQFEEGVDYAHVRSSKVYLTVNTLVNDSEREDLFDAVAKFVGASKDTIWAGIVAFVISLVFSVLLYYSLAYFVSAVSSLMAKSTGVQRFLTITFVILFMIFFSVLSKSMPKFTNDISNEPISKLVEAIPTYLLSLGFTALFTYGCGYLMKNKLSL